MSASSPSTPAISASATAPLVPLASASKQLAANAATGSTTWELPLTLRHQMEEDESILSMEWARFPEVRHPVLCVGTGMSRGEDFHCKGKVYAFAIPDHRHKRLNQLGGAGAAQLIGAEPPECIFMKQVR